jgi:hypothetical protein
MSLVESYFIDILDHDMVKIMFNLKTKSTIINRVSTNLYWLSDDEIGIKHEEFIPSGFPNLEGYSCFQQREKDQHTFLFVPGHQLIKEGKIKEFWKEKHKLTKA